MCDVLYLDSFVLFSGDHSQMYFIIFISTMKDFPHTLFPRKERVGYILGGWASESQWVIKVSPHGAASITQKEPPKWKAKCAPKRAIKAAKLKSATAIKISWKLPVWSFLEWNELQLRFEVDARGCGVIDLLVSRVESALYWPRYEKYDEGWNENSDSYC